MLLYDKVRSLGCFSFSAALHASILVGAVLFNPQIIEDQQAQILNVLGGGASRSSSTQNKSAAMAKQSQLEFVEPIDLPTKTSHDKKILLAKADDPNAVVIKPPPETDSKTDAPEKKTPVAVVATPTPAPAPAPKKVTTLPKKAKPKKVANVKPTPTPAPKKPVEEEKSQDIAAESTPAFVPVREKLDVEPAEDVAEVAPAPQPQPMEAQAPEFVAEPEPQPEPVAAVQKAPPAPAQAAPEHRQNVAAMVAQPASRGGPANGNGSGTGAGDSMGPSAGEIRDGDSLAELPGNPRPKYPVEDRRAGREGTATFLAKISPDGRVTSIQLESGATQAMTSEALKAFQTYHYKANQEGWIRKKFVFRLSGDSQEIPARLRRTTSGS